MPRQPAEILWLHITLSDGLDAAGADEWRKRLQTHLATHNLLTAISPRRMAVMPFGRPMSAHVRGQLIGWLVAQPEVIVVQFEPSALTSARRVLRRNDGRKHG
jgi:hypothetical protein